MGPTDNNKEFDIAHSITEHLCCVTKNSVKINSLILKYNNWVYEVLIK